MYVSLLIMTLKLTSLTKLPETDWAFPEIEIDGSGKLVMPNWLDEIVRKGRT